MMELFQLIKKTNIDSQSESIIYLYCYIGILFIIPCEVTFLSPCLWTFMTSEECLYEARLFYNSVETFPVPKYRD